MATILGQQTHQGNCLLSRLGSDSDERIRDAGTVSIPRLQNATRKKTAAPSGNSGFFTSTSADQAASTSGDCPTSST
jgi:hypothetical protein